MKPRILIVEDDQAARFGYSRYLSSDYEVQEAATAQETKRALRNGVRFDAVILDMVLPDGNGIDLIGDIRTASPTTAVIMVTALGDIPLAVEAMRRGADNFLTKPVNMSELEVFLKKNIELGALRRRELKRSLLFEGVRPYMGESPAMKRVAEMAALAAGSLSPVLVTGETGTGKGLLAKWIHENSLRASEPFVEINCSSIRGELLASELFGHVRGAFTSAVSDKQGLVEAADGGTLFLDEIGDMDLDVQARFLKVIEEKSFRRLGEVRLRSSDFRPICATNKDLGADAAGGRFRKDLYFRISVFPIAMPSLRDIREELPGFVRHILDGFGALGTTVPDSVMDILKGYSWPGNIRELKNVLERALILSRGGPLAPEHFLISPEAWAGRVGGATIEDAERGHIKDVLERSGGDVRRAAEVLGVSRSTMYRKLKQHGLDDRA